MGGGWAGSTRRDTLPPDWRTRIRPAVIARDKVCQWRMSEGGKCGAPGNQVDHIGDRLDHRLENLQLLCAEHHNLKSSRQGNAAKPRERRPPEKHPGLL